MSTRREFLKITAGAAAVAAAPAVASPVTGPKVPLRADVPDAIRIGVDAPVGRGEDGSLYYCTSEGRLYLFDGQAWLAIVPDAIRTEELA